MAISQNGYPVLDVRPPSQPVRGTDIRLTVRPGDVATVLLEVAARFHAEVERLTYAVHEPPGFDDWGWNPRLVRGSATVISNHASGTAIDLNATRHPRGVKGTFSRRKRAKVRSILAATLDPVTRQEVVRWGETYTGTVDGMHFEINASKAAVARVAARIRVTAPARPTPAPVTPMEEDDDMKSSDQIDLGTHSSIVLGQPDKKITYEEAIAIQTAALASIDETLQALAKSQAETLALLRQRTP